MDEHDGISVFEQDMFENSILGMDYANAERALDEAIREFARGMVKERAWIV